MTCYIVYQRLLPFEYIPCFMTICYLQLFSNLITLQHRPFYTIFIHYAYLKLLQGIPQFVFEAFLMKN
jgi:hypothetical protein